MKKTYVFLAILIVVLMCGCDTTKTSIQQETETKDDFLTIDEVIDTRINTEVATKGLVVGKNDDGFVLKDDGNRIFVRFFNNINDITVNSYIAVYGKHSYINGNKITVSKIEQFDKENITDKAKNITDEDIKTIINTFNETQHTLNFVTLTAKVISENNTFVLQTNTYSVATNNQQSVDADLAKNINKECAIKGYIYECEDNRLTMLVTDVIAINDNIDSSNPNIIVESNYYHYTSVNQVEQLTNYFKVYDIEDGVIDVTNDMISGKISTGKNIITLTVTDSDNNISTSSIVINVGKHKTFKSVESITKIDENCMPPTGNSKVLVIPVAIGDHPKTEEMRDKIEKAFFGTSEDTGWESLQSYYYKSSYTKLNISGDVTPWYQAKKSQKYYANYEDNDDYFYGSTVILDEALEFFKDDYDYSDYDSNKDGYIDAVYLIYNCPIGGNGSPSQEETYWAYQTVDYYVDYRDYQDTKGYAYIFMGYDFFDEELYYDKRKIDINCQTLIHETGHLLNLDDYYDYDENDKYNNDGGYCGADMMDFNIGDHGPVSKIILNWIEPVLIEKSGIYQLPSFAKEGIAFVINTDCKDENFNSIFDEYYVIDFFTFDELNKLESDSFFKTNRGYAGVRVSLANTTLEYESSYYDYKYNNTDSEHKIIQMLEADYDGKFDLSVANNLGANIYDFYQIGDTFGNNYYEDFTSSDGNKIPFIMEVLDINSEYATIKITFK